jgi:hypothetical protein
MIRCPKCGENRSAEDFHKHAARKSGRQSRCKSCVAERSKARYLRDPKGEMDRSRRWRETNPARSAEWYRNWYARNLDKRKKQGRKWRKENQTHRLEYDRKRHALNPAYREGRSEKYRMKNRDNLEAKRLKRQYNLTPSELGRMVARQGGKCAVCGADFLDTKRRHVDHDHTTGKVRGLLCQRCNMALGLLDDSPERLRAAADYLERPCTPT